MKTKLLSILLISIVSMSFSNQKEKKLVFFGDSITAGAVKEGGYIRLIESKAEKEGVIGIDFIGAGISGNKVTDLYLRLDKDVLAQSPDVVVIYIGVNDIWHKRTSGTGTDFVKFGGFYDAIVKKLLDEGIKVVLCTPACIGERNGFVNESDGDMNLYSQWIIDYAYENQIPLVDLRQAFLNYNL